MDAFLEHLQSPDFLLFSVCLALILSVLANYVTRVLDRIFGSGKSWMLGISKRSRDKRIARDLVEARGRSSIAADRLHRDVTAAQ
jgi:hypothetical protein